MLMHDTLAKNMCCFCLTIECLTLFIKNMNIKFTNTVTGNKEEFKSLQPGQVKLYVCGVTPYDFAHVGHGRCYTTFDTLYRMLTFLDYKVTYCRNFTDIDDKIIKRAQTELGDKNKYKEIADKYIAAYTQDMTRLNCLSPDYEPRVTDVIPEIVSFISGLINAGKAYVVDGDVYFSIESFAAYGKLSKHKLEDLRAGSRVDVNTKKHDPLDFALWKSEPEGHVWKSPWGYGRPGWHIECSVMASKYLGKHIDIHGGGMDLIFPHHENEIAQSESLLGGTFVNYWVHNGFVRINQEKMSKSLGNFFTLRDVFKEFDPMVVRFYLLSVHYRAPLDFSFDDLKAIEKSYRRLSRVFAREICTQDLDKQAIGKSSVVQKMLSFLVDDLNTSGMWGVLFENIGLLQEDETERCAVRTFVNLVLGITLEPLPEKELEITPEIQELIDARIQARKDKNWAKADEIRDQLEALGVQLQDKKI